MEQTEHDKQVGTVRMLNVPAKATERGSQHATLSPF